MLYSILSLIAFAWADTTVTWATAVEADTTAQPEGWDAELVDFRANIFENITISAGSKHVTACMTQTGVKIRGAFVVEPAGVNSAAVDYEIGDPAGVVVFSARNERKGRPRD